MTALVFTSTPVTLLKRFRSRSSSLSILRGTLMSILPSMSFDFTASRVVRQEDLDPIPPVALLSLFAFKTVELRKGTALAQALRDTCD
jgi:hypothetical protein